MSNYTKATNFASKDSLLTGNPLKIVKGTEIDNEFNAIATAVSTKFDTTALAAPGPIGATTPAAISGTAINGTTGTFTGAVSGTTGTFSGNVQMASANGGQLAGLRNKIINGNMSIAQRGATAVTTNGTYGPADRWYSGSNIDTFSTTQGSFVSGDTLYDTGGAQYFTTIAVTSVAGIANYSLFAQKIEDVRLFAGETVTVSFWAKAASGTPSIGLSIEQSFGSGGSPDVTGTGQAQALTTTWTQYSKTFTLPSISGKTVGTANTHFTNVVFWLDAGSNFNTRSGSIGQASKTVSIAQVQLEIGSVSTPFEYRPIQIETALCQRYFYAPASPALMNVAGYAPAGGGAIYVSYSLPQVMRSTPLATTSWTSLLNATGSATRYPDTKTIESNILSVAAGTESGVYNVTSATAEL